MELIPFSPFIKEKLKPFVYFFCQISSKHDHQTSAHLTHPHTHTLCVSETMGNGPVGPEGHQVAIHSSGSQGDVARWLMGALRCTICFTIRAYPNGK